MYPCSTTSSSSCQSQNSTISESGLTRYGSAPGSLLRTAVDAVIAGGPLGVGVGGHYFTASATATGESSQSPCKVNNSSSSSDPKEQHKGGGGGGLQRSYGFQEALGGGGSSSLVRQRSSPAVFLNHLATSAHLHDNNNNNSNNNNSGFTITRGSGSSYSSNVVSNSGHGHGVARLKSQLSFTGQESLTQISEVSESESAAADHRLPYGHGHGHGHGPSPSSSTFAMDPWDSSNSNSIVFSANKRPKNIDGDILNCLTALDSQFGLPQTSLEMATMDKLMHIPEDSVPCKIRAKRGCATHPRSIAERERRTRISGKLKKLQELVPNMDKQTSYADMLDLAVQHIKGLQGQVQKLHNELENCTCGCKPST